MAYSRDRHRMSGPGHAERRLVEEATGTERWPVVVVGAGPAGLALAIELGSRGVRTLVLERSDRVGHAPRAKTTHTRTREHMRRWGIADDLAEAAPFGVDYPSTVLFVTRLAGYELARFEDAFNCSPTRDERYSEHAQWVPQYRLEEVLRRHAASLPAVEFRFGANVEAIEPTPDGARCRVSDSASGRPFNVEADYLVGADGARSMVRDAIGARMEGEFGRSRHLNIIFRAPGLADAHPHGPAIMYWQVNPDLPSTIGPMDKGDLWFFMPGNVPSDLALTDEVAGALIRRASGIDMPLEILSSDEWYANRLIADRYREGRAFIIGDACHLHPPLGGYGMNMGVSDAVDLGWKLAAVLDGWADPALLDSYEAERGPVHRRVIDEASSNAAANAAVLQPGLEADDEAGAARRAELGHRIRVTRAQEFRSLGVVLGSNYAGSPFVASGGEAPGTLTTDYVPTAAPGHLAPHAWLDDGRSLYDLFGTGFTLLVTGDNQAADVEAAARDAEAAGIPLKLVLAPSERLRTLYGTPLALIRPDQHVTWRGGHWPGPGILARATGRATHLEMGVDASAGSGATRTTAEGC